MGGIGSGVYRSTQVGDVEDALALDIRVLRRLGLVRPGVCVIDTVNWSKRDLRTASARLRADLSDIERGGVVTITSAMPDGTIKQQIAVEGVPSGFGGHRCYFVCPTTAERCEVLYYSEGRFASRRAHKLSYASQNLNDLSRARRKVAKLRAHLTGEGGCRRPRGRNRITLEGKIDRAVSDAHALYIDCLRSHTERSGSRS